MTLHITAENRHETVVLLLAMKGAEIKAYTPGAPGGPQRSFAMTDGIGQTLMRGVMQLPLKKGTNVEAKDRHIFTVRDYMTKSVALDNSAVVRDCCRFLTIL